MKGSMKKNKFLTFLDLYFAFLKIGSFTFGGGLAMMPMMQRELIQNRRWITEDELIDYYAVGQSTPGIVAVNVATFVGYKQLGILGGIIATLGVVTPSLIIIMLLASFISSIDQFPIVQKALKGINVAVAALLTQVIVNFSKKTIKNWVNVVFMLLAFVLIFVFKVQSVWCILFGIITGVIITAVKTKRNKNKDVESKDAESEGGENVNS